ANGAWWLDHGPGFVKSYVAWREKTGWDIWTAETGEFGVELELNFMLSEDGPQVKGFIDRVFQLPSGDLVLLDIKTSARKPDEPIQLGVYACGMQAVYGVRPEYGSY